MNLIRKQFAIESKTLLDRRPSELFEMIVSTNAQFIRSLILLP